MRIFFYFMKMMIYAEEYIIKKNLLYKFDAVAIHQHGEGESISNFLKKTFIINYNMTYSELLYFYKINKHHEKFNILKKKFQTIFLNLF